MDAEIDIEAARVEVGRKARVDRVRQAAAIPHLAEQARRAAVAHDRIQQVGCGAAILGNITIGDDAIIGANAVVAVDVPTNAMVVVPPPRIVAKQSSEVSPQRGNDLYVFPDRDGSSHQIDALL